MPFPIVAVLGVVGSIIDKIIPDPQAAMAAKIKMVELQQSSDFKEIDANLQNALAQIGVNQEEAKAPGIFRGGWRPFIGWVCGAAFAYNYLVYPMLVWAATIWAMPTIPPALDLGELMPVLLGMLGLGGMRMYERVKGKAGSGASL